MLPSHFLIGSLATTSGPIAPGVGCARYLRQQARDREDARLCEQARWKTGGHSEIARRLHQEELHPAIDPSLSVAHHLSGEAPRAAVSLAATPCPD